MVATCEAPVSAPEPIIFEAIVRKLCLHAMYNRMSCTLAPHVIYTRHGDLFIDAVTLERDGKVPKELKLGTFKMAGLSELRVTARRFSNSDLFSPRDPKYDRVALMMVEA